MKILEALQPQQAAAARHLLFRDAIALPFSETSWPPGTRTPAVMTLEAPLEIPRLRFKKSAAAAAAPRTSREEGGLM